MKIYKKILLIAIFIIGLLVSSSFAKSGKVIVDAARIREKTNTESKIIDIVYEDDIVEILDEKDDWYKIKYNDSVGYSKKSFFKVEEKNQSKPTTNTASNVASTNTTLKNTNTQADTSTNKVSNNVVSNNTISNTSTNITNTINNVSNTSTNNVTTQKQEENQNKSEINIKISVNSNVSMRVLPNFMSTTIEQIDPSKEITKVAEMNNWSQVTDGILVGWIPNSKIAISDNKPEETTPESKPENTTVTPTPTPVSSTNIASNENKQEAVSKTGTVNVETANVRKEATQNSDVINTLDYGNIVTIIAEEGDWYKITRGEVSGYVKKSLLTNVKEKSVSSRSLEEERKDNTTIEENTNNAISKTLENGTKSSITGNDVSEYAKKYIGTNYVVGGKTPEAGFNCSGFTRYVFLNFGYNLGNTAAGQNNIGEEVSKEDLQSGDLMLFYDEAKNKIGHTGVYISNGEFVHAANPERGVVIDNLNTNTYYNERFIVGKRIIQN